MRDISELEALPSSLSLIKSTLLAVVIGALLLVLVILPAEYAIDPTGVGKWLGLTELNAGKPDKTNPSEIKPEKTKTGQTQLSKAEANKATTPSWQSAQLPPVWMSDSEYRSDTRQLILQPGQGTEIKAKMKAGDNFVFSWSVDGGAVYFDMHGERPNAGSEFTSYWEGNQSSAHGSFDAPFMGTHGWYWKNNGTNPVTVNLVTSGFYDGLYQP